jgi:hypothetical protein
MTPSVSHFALVRLDKKYGAHLDGLTNSKGVRFSVAQSPHTSGARLKELRQFPAQTPLGEYTRSVGALGPDHQDHK